MNRKSRVLIGSLAALGAIAAAPAGTALASPSSAAAVHSAARAESPAAGSPYSCPGGYFCIYTGANFTGTMYKFNSDTPTLPSGIINNDASFVNFTPNDVRLWYGPNEGNPHTCLYSDTGEGPTVVGNLLTPIHYYFNSNTTGTREYVYDNVHGITFTTSCTAFMENE